MKIKIILQYKSITLIKKTIDHDSVLVWSPLELLNGINKFDQDFVLAKKIHHPVKQKQFCAGRQLLRKLTGDDSVIVYDQFGGPIVLEKQHLEVSLSHSDDMVAAACSKRPIGIDIQNKTEKLIKIIERFLSNDELLIASSTNRQIYAQFCWSAKEAMFKAYRKGNIDFRKQLKPNIPVDQLNKTEFDSIGELVIGDEVKLMKLNFFKHHEYSIVSAILL